MLTNKLVRNASIMIVSAALSLPLSIQAQTPQKALQASQITISAVDQSLFDAVKVENKKTVEKAIKAGANVNAKDEDGRTSLMLAVHGNKKSSITKLLLKNGAEVKSQDNNGNSVMHYAVTTPQDGNRKIRTLSKYNTPPEIKNNLGLRPIDILNTDETVANYATVWGGNAYRIQQTRRSALKEAVIQAKGGRTSRLVINPGALIIKPEGSGKSCYYAMAIGNLTGSGLRGEFSVRLTNGRYQEYASRAGGTFYIPGTAGALKHTIWLNQGATIRLEVVSDRGGSWSDLIDFKTDPNCRDGRNDIYGKKFVVELDNNRSRISIFEDANGDGRRDNFSASPSQISPQTATTTQCAKLTTLATQIKPDNSGLSYNDERLNGLYAALGCEIPASVSQQRNQIKQLIHR